MRMSECNGEFSKILVKCDDCAFLIESSRKYFDVRRTTLPVTRPDDIVPIARKLCDGTRPYAGIEKEFHAASMAGSTRSCPTTRRA